MPPGGANGLPLWFRGKNCTATLIQSASLARPGHSTGARLASINQS